MTPAGHGSVGRTRSANRCVRGSLLSAVNFAAAASNPVALQHHYAADGEKHAFFPAESWPPRKRTWRGRSSDLGPREPLELTESSAPQVDLCRRTQSREFWGTVKPWCEFCLEFLAWGQKSRRTQGESWGVGRCARARLNFRAALTLTPDVETNMSSANVLITCDCVLYFKAFWSVCRRGGLLFSSKEAFS